MDPNAPRSERKTEVRDALRERLALVRGWTVARAHAPPEEPEPEPELERALGGDSALQSLAEATAARAAGDERLAALCADVLAKRLRLSESPEAEWAALGALQNLLAHRRLDVGRFLRRGGLPALLALPTATRGAHAPRPPASRGQHEERYLQCVEQLMSGGHGTGPPSEQRRLVSAALLRLPGGLGALATMLSSRELRVKLHTLQLLTRAAALAPLGGRAVSDALDGLALLLRAQPDGPARRFAPVVTLLTAAVDSPALQCRCMRLINALVSLQHNVLARHAVRCELEAGVGLRARLKALHRQVQHETDADSRALSEQLGLYRESELRDEKALMTVREQHRSLLETQQELQIAVQRWSHHTPSATAELVQVLRGALFGTLNRAGAGPTAQGAQDGAMQSEDYEDGGVLTALRRRWIAVGGFVGLAAEAAQPPPLQAPDEFQPGQDGWAESDAGSQALHAAAYMVCDLLREIGGPGSAAATVADELEASMAQVLYDVFVEWIVSTHGVDAADRLLEHGDLSGLEHNGLLHRIQWQHARRREPTGAASPDAAPLPSAAEVAALRREVATLQWNQVQATQETVAARRSVRAEHAAKAEAEAGQRRLQALHTAHVAQLAQLYAIALAQRERWTQPHEQVLPLRKVEAPPLGSALVEVGVDETARLPFPLPHGTEVSFVVPEGAREGDLLFVKPNPRRDPESAPPVLVRSADAGEAETLEQEPEPEPEPEPELESKPQPQPQPQPEPELQPEQTRPQPEPEPEQPEQAPPPPTPADEHLPVPQLPTAAPPKDLLIVPWSKLPAKGAVARSSVFSGASDEHWDPARDTTLLTPVHSGALHDWFSVDALALPGSSPLLPKREIAINGDLTKLKLNLAKIRLVLKDDYNGRKPPLDLAGWKLLQQLLPAATVGGVQNPVAAVDEISTIRAELRKGASGKPRPPAERFMLEMATIDGVEQRVRLRILEREWVVGVRDSGEKAELLMGSQMLHAALDATRQAFEELRAASETLGTMLSLVLQVGNHLNGGTANGAAWGFGVQDCLLLRGIRSNVAWGSPERGSTLLDFVVRAAAQHEATDGGALLRWPASLAKVREEAEKQQLRRVGDSLQQWSRRLAEARLDADILAEGSQAAQPTAWDQLVDKVDGELTDVRGLYSELLAEQSELEERFGFEARSAATDSPPDAAEPEPEPEPTFEGGLMEALGAFAAQWEEAAAVLEGA